MASENGFRFTPNFVVGVAMTAAGVVLTLDTLDLVNARELARYWPVLLILFGASIAVQAFQGAPDGTPPGRAQRPIVTPGLVIVFVVVGLLVSNAYQRRSGGPADASTDSVVAVMGRASRTSDPRTFTGADMTSVMGRSLLDLRAAALAPGEDAYVNVFGMMGAVELIVPQGWTVDVEGVPVVMGRVDDSRFRPGPTRAEAAPPQDGSPGAPPAEAAKPPRLVVRGFIMMGRLNIRS